MDDRKRIKRRSTDEPKSRVRKPPSELPTGVRQAKGEKKEILPSREQFLNMFDNLENGFLYFDLVKNQIIFASSAIEKIYGRPVKDFNDNPKLWQEVIHPDDIGDLRAALTATISGRKAAGRWRIVRPDGKVLTASWTFVPTVDTTGKMIGFVVMVSDVTKQRTATELTQFIDTANAPIFGVDNKGLITEWNQKTTEITGYKKDEVLGKNLVENYITEDYKDSVKEVLDKALRGEETANYELPLYTKDKKRVMVLLNATTRRDPSGNIIGVIGIGQDITELDSYRSQLQQKVKERTVELEGAVARLENEVVEHRKAEGDKEKALSGLSERVKELNTIYDLSGLVETPNIKLEEILQRMVRLIPNGWRYPEDTCARITFNGKNFQTDNFRETKWRQSADLTGFGKKTGTLEVYYLQEKPKAEEGPFLKEERNLIKAIAERLGR
ncbi:PAS domain S-box protein, partial [Candidatus Aerophobetes bacterium]|nr:PAS domain S-box protein [Candidatus Aerophobetes bacterium]